ncbi:Tetraacyldisaccharide 4'-kinase [Mariniflexile rhizosphaerae]|uniref:tetraacyldisaccharide 4'-kinase n=1 Tax=unclassified Mariniflexile TaxID=2643887 RepID=UPI000CA6B48E|nr:tetraacyldisaccharide 4'-kinase [Mariniflexile sp. TRM1-10]AXP79872.1 Tetraacyldisaccharide 4'-kinase [Mariniflexile sp. TRM1-10]PLB21124.1 MAG: Tetraacyldisaccharide 4'-kinase [Flavobacteriaceae bacterium FS1-H7996/R]
MKLIRNISFPFVPVYYAITSLRNRLYDLGIKKSISYSFPVICVGNLSVGGTGKTPMIEYLIDLLKDDCKVATLSRGYKRRTKGFQLANEFSTAESIGDEPFQFYNKFKNDILVAVDADRAHGIKQLKQLDNAPKVILLDDAFQHRKVKAGLNILLTTYSNPYFSDYVLPTGNLREPRSGAKRADIIVVTKCPDNFSSEAQSDFLKKIAPEVYQQVFFSSINYSNDIISSASKKSLDVVTNFTLVTGIANANPLVEFLNKKGLQFEHLNFKDHYEFTQQDILALEKKELILTTEKDFMRLKQHETLKDKLFYLPITVTISNAPILNKLIKDFATC